MTNGTRERMVAGARMLLAEKGLQETSFSTVLARTGAPRGSIYHHFPDGKDELIAAAVDEAGAFALDRMEATDGLPAVEVVDTFLGLWRAVLERSGMRMGCAVLAVTVATDASPLLDHAAAVFRGWRSQLTRLLDHGGLPNPEGAAATLIAAVEGAVAISRAERSMEPFELVAAELRAQVARRAAKGPASPSAVVDNVAR